jgi:oxygen-independent coproporphyrinogen-3 oxidase
METSWQNKADQCDELNLAKSDLHDLEKDGLISIGDQWLKVTNQGKPFLRIVCKALDYKLREVKDLSNCFSQAI